ncbi:MAG TPA: AAA family ATPase [Solirubrobacteraceae bacterium]|nr:AAA family ATPase [Solirubrobacteraceae bacterium]
MDANEFAYFSDQVAAGKVILFTGAGFSLQARADDGHTVSSASQLLHELWPIVYGSAGYDGSTLADVFGAAQQRHVTATRDLLNRRLRVSRENLPDEYRIWFSFPWYRVYTLNVDTLADVVQTEYELPRRIKSLSALTDPPPASTPELVVVHLNGKVSAFPDVTFSQRNYAERQALADLWYPTLVRELSTYTVLYVGSTLDEPPLWQYVEARALRSRGPSELRPKSFLVTKELPLGRQSLLGEFNIRYEDGTQEKFCAETLSQLSDAATRGHLSLRRAYQADAAAPPFLSISDLASAPLRDAAELLFGREPRWPDITEGYAVERECDRELLERVRTEDLRLVLLTGTAGSGKTLTAMRIALALVADGASGYVYNSDFTGGIRAVRDAANNAEAKVVVIDNADRFGEAMSDLLTALAEDDYERVVIATVRTTRRDPQALARIESAAGVEFHEPPLTDSDIASLLDSLTDARRLGDLEDKSRAQQEAVFRDKSGRQLLVAMIEATSGLGFDQKVASECEELNAQDLLVYAVLTLASAHGTALDRNELLAACGGDPVASAGALKDLVDKHLVITSDNARLAIRHRVIAEHALDFFQSAEVAS